MAGVNPVARASPVLRVNRAPPGLPVSPVHKRASVSLKRRVVRRSRAALACAAVVAQSWHRPRALTGSVAAAQLASLVLVLVLGRLALLLAPPLLEQLESLAPLQVPLAPRQVLLARACPGRGAPAQSRRRESLWTGL